MIFMLYAVDGTTASLEWLMTKHFMSFNKYLFWKVCASAQRLWQSAEQSTCVSAHQQQTLPPPVDYNSGLCLRRSENPSVIPEAAMLCLLLDVHCQWAGVNEIVELKSALQWCQIWCEKTLRIYFDTLPIACGDGWPPVMACHKVFVISILTLHFCSLIQRHSYTLLCLPQESREDRLSSWWLPLPGGQLAWDGVSPGTHDWWYPSPSAPEPLGVKPLCWRSYSLAPVRQPHSVLPPSLPPSVGGEMYWVCNKTDRCIQMVVWLIYKAEWSMAFSRDAEPLQKLVGFISSAAQALHFYRGPDLSSPYILSLFVFTDVLFEAHPQCKVTHWKMSVQHGCL